MPFLIANYCRNDFGLMRLAMLLHSFQQIAIINTKVSWPRLYCFARRPEFNSLQNNFVCHALVTAFFIAAASSKLIQLRSIRFCIVMLQTPSAFAF